MNFLEGSTVPVSDFTGKNSKAPRIRQKQANGSAVEVCLIAVI